jgi:hypothetical protein
MVFVLALAMATVWLAGCNRGADGPRRYRLSGKATYGGTPIPFGHIVFEPDSAAGNSGPQGMAEIHDGQYATDQGKGPIGGAHRIRIAGFDRQQLDETQTPAKALFPEHQTTVDLPMQDGTYNFEVPTAGQKSDRGT